MSEHLLEELVDFVAGRSDPPRRREIEEHLSRCPECSDRRDWMERFRDEAMRDGLGHPTAARLVELGDPSNVPSELERKHLEDCRECGPDLEMLQRAPSAGDIVAATAAGSEPASPVDTRRWSGRWPWLALAAASAAATIFLLVILPPGPGPGLTQLARIEAMPLEINRTAPGADPFESARLEGLVAYKTGDYEGARQALGRALAIRGEDAVAGLYLASVELLLGRTADAVPLLERIGERAEDPFIREEALWQLANAELARGRVGQAVLRLEQVIASGEYRREDARKLLESIEAAR